MIMYKFFATESVTEIKKYRSKRDIYCKKFSQFFIFKS